ncbi:MAG: hypothetical protein KAJ35_05100, partial [Thermoplasmata archaeon]|nr:hypothetical protein [Thermoplasmata archaeon]
MNKIGMVLSVIALVVDIAIAIYCMFAIAGAMDWSAIGFAIGALYATMMAVYAIVLFAIGLIPKVGWLIALVISLSDALTAWIFGKGWSQMLMEFIIDLVTDFNTRTEADIKMEGSTTIIDDKDGNGVDVGDRIEFKSYVLTRINRTSDGYWGDVLDSYIHPGNSISIPANTNTVTGTYSESTAVRNDPNRRYQETDYEVGAWFEPGIPMINFPMTLTFNTDMRTYYEECFWAVVWWCDRKETTCTTASDPSTLYFDVMPGSIDAFAKWRGITSNDYDGDSINNTDEEKTDIWKWDTDGDGLGDAYEYEIGTMPWRYDSDRDGLDDKTEHLWGTDPTVKDTDGDGLSDYIEHNGWVVNFDYFGETFNWHINSNPLFNNTDGDAVVDYMEYKTLQNPMSKDTNGDGIEDETKDYYETFFFHQKNVAESFRPRAVAVDDKDNVYVAVKRSSSSPYEDCFVKYDDQGNMINHFYDLSGPNDLYRIEDMKVDRNGYLYIADLNRGVVRFDTSHKHDTSFAIPYGTFFQPTGLDVDNDGNVYITEQQTDKVWIVDNTGTVIDSWGGPSSTEDGKFLDPNSIAVHPDGYVYVCDETNRIQKLYPNGTHIATYTGTVFGTFNNIEDVDVDANGDVFVSDYNAHNIQKMNENGSWIRTLGSRGSANGKFINPYEMTVTEDNDIYIVDRGNYRIQKMWQQVEFIPASPPDTFIDTDGDSLNDVDEANEWTVTVINASGTISFNVSSSIMSPDTDNDGLNDLKEFQLKSDPTSPDTDGDGVP